MKKQKKWTTTELEILRSQYSKRPLKDTVFLLGRTEAAASNKASRIGLRKGHRRIEWTDWMIQLLKDHYPDTNTETVAQWLEMSPDTVLKKAHELSLRKTGPRNRDKMHTPDGRIHHITPEDGEYIRTHMGREKVKDIAARLGFSLQSIWDYCNKNGIPHSRISRTKKNKNIDGKTNQTTYAPEMDPNGN